MKTRSHFDGPRSAQTHNLAFILEKWRARGKTEEIAEGEGKAFSEKSEDNKNKRIFGPLYHIEAFLLDFGFLGKGGEYF